MPPGDSGDHAVDQAPWRDTGLPASAVDACGGFEVGGWVELVQVELHLTCMIGVSSRGEDLVQDVAALLRQGHEPAVVAGKLDR